MGLVIVVVGSPPNFLVVHFLRVLLILKLLFVFAPLLKPMSWGLISMFLLI
ncbi:hypothetical protein F2Q69_00018063 [Brassica cretica]|uniref:Uncharacterized protein n=2 Tax=Brassica cretica TaxID=69181 RepID=A0ABQ7DNI9_BRACR|nr:hypothetical protein F2Q69_00018063 [Brassica cretica]KAF3578609.1 hypothetical protein DY000_02036015 [Brassica cretica]